MVRMASLISRMVPLSKVSLLCCLPHQGLVVGRHRVIAEKDQILLLCERIHCLEVADAASRIAVTQDLVKPGVAFASVVSFVTERAIDAEHPGAREGRADPLKQGLNGLPAHD